MSHGNTRRLWEAAYTDGKAMDLASGESIVLKPTVDNQGSIEIGDGTTDMDCKVFLGASTDFATFDVSAGHVVFDNAEINMGDNDEIEFGDGPDAQIQWDGTILRGGPVTGMWSNAPSPLMADYDTVCVTEFNDFTETGRDFLAANWTTTEDDAADTQAITTDTVGGTILLTQKATTDNDAAQIQRVDEAFKAASGKQMWYETRIRCAAGDATNLDFFVGLCAADLTPVADNMPANGIGFHKDDAAAVIDLSTSDGGANVESSTVHTLVDNTWVKLGFHWDGAATGSVTITPYVDGVAGTAITTGAYATMVEIAPIFMVRNGDATTTQTLEVDYYKCVQLR